jgi:hypothetical protein
MTIDPLEINGWPRVYYRQVVAQPECLPRAGQLARRTPVGVMTTWRPMLATGG